jgi:hypothetical protein
MITHEVNFRKTAEKTLVEEVCQVLKELAFEDDEGKLLIKTGDELILIHKQSLAY